MASPTANRWNLLSREDESFANAACFALQRWSSRLTSAAEPRNLASTTHLHQPRRCRGTMTRTRHVVVKDGQARWTECTGAAEQRPALTVTARLPVKMRGVAVRYPGDAPG